jgi:hypothetical protein
MVISVISSLLALMRKPGMVQIGADQRQFQVLNNFNIAAYNPLGALGVDDEVQLILVMVMKRKIELGLHPRKMVKQSLGVSGVISRITLLISTYLIGLQVY